MTETPGQRDERLRDDFIEDYVEAASSEPHCTRNMDELFADAWADWEQSRIDAEARKRG